MKYYVYEWRDPRPDKNNEVWYVGKGSGKRAFQTKRRGKMFLDKFNHLCSLGYNPEPVIVKYFESEQEAYDYEEILIEKYGRKNIGSGSLMNDQAGGTGGTSESSRLAQLKRVQEGTHNFNSKNTQKWATERVKSRKHHFCDSNWQKEMNRRAYESTNHPFIGGDLQREVNKKRIKNNSHNFLGPDQNNKRVQDGTHNFLNPEDNVHAKLTKEQAYEIKYHRKDEDPQLLADEYGIQRQSIYKIWKGLTWKKL